MKPTELGKTGANGSLFFKRLAFRYFSTEVVRFGLIKKRKNQTSYCIFQSHAILLGIVIKDLENKKSGQITPCLGQIALTIGVFWPLHFLCKTHFLQILFSKLKFLILYWYINGQIDINTIKSVWVTVIKKNNKH